MVCAASGVARPAHEPVGAAQGGALGARRDLSASDLPGGPRWPERAAHHPLAHRPSVHQPRSSSSARASTATTSASPARSAGRGEPTARTGRRSSPVISGHLRPPPAISGHLRPSRVISGHLGSSRVISGYLGLSRVISDRPSQRPQSRVHEISISSTRLLGLRSLLPQGRDVWDFSQVIGGGKLQWHIDGAFWKAPASRESSHKFVDCCAAFEKPPAFSLITVEPSGRRRLRARAGCPAAWLACGVSRRPRRRASARRTMATGRRCRVPRARQRSAQERSLVSPRPLEITRDHSRPPEITRDHSRSPEITRGHPRSPEVRSGRL